MSSRIRLARTLRADSRCRRRTRLWNMAEFRPVPLRRTRPPLAADVPDAPRCQRRLLDRTRSPRHPECSRTSTAAPDRGWHPRLLSDSGSRAGPSRSATRSVMPSSTSPRVRRTPGISCEAVPASDVRRRGHEAACPCWQPCRRKLRQLHPLVRPHVVSPTSVRRSAGRSLPELPRRYALGRKRDDLERPEEPHSTWPRPCPHAPEARAGAAPATTARDVTPMALYGHSR